MAVLFDSVSILGGNYVPRFIKHETIPERELAMMSLARENGSILISEKYGVKRITIMGFVKASSQSALETQIDEFKELFSRKAKTLSISWAGSTRNYIAYCVRHEFDRDHMHIDFVPFFAEFIVPTGIGKGPDSLEAHNGSATSDEEDLTFALPLGSMAPKPHSVGMTFSTLQNAGRKGVAVKSQDKKFIYTQAADLAAAESVGFNCVDKIALFGATEVGFHGPFPEFVLGNNTVSFEFGEIDINNGDYSIGGSGQNIFGNNWRAQSFTMPWKDESIQVISINGGETGTPPNNLTVRVETDDGGKPSGTLADANATVDIAPGAFPLAGAKHKVVFANAFTLEANTRYWIVAKSTGGDSGDCFYWVKTGQDYYSKGNASDSVDAGVNWVDDPDDDYSFEIWVGGKRPGGNIQVLILAYYYPFYL